MSLSSLDWSTDETLWSRWRRHADLTPDREAIAFARAGEPTDRWTWGRLMARAERYASWLQAQGVRTGHTCAIISKHHVEFYPLYLGICAIGAIPAVLAYPNDRLHPDKFREGLLGAARYSGLDWLLTQNELRPMVGPLLEEGTAKLQAILFPYDADLPESGSYRPAAVGSRSPALLQHSSGTTGLQKAVVLSHYAILEHVARYGAAIAVRGDDRVVSWLPLYHDMGLIAAFHLPLALGIPVVHVSAFEWVMAPILLIEALSSEQGTLCWLPNFAYALMGARLREDELDGLTLDRVRLLINCSEPVRAESQNALFDKLQRCGLRRSALGASYAMAETTFAVTQTIPGEPPVVRVVSRDALALGQARAALAGEATRTCVSSGVAIAGCEVDVLDPAGTRLGEGGVGELVVRSVSLFDGYRNRPEKTAEVLQSGWYHTGDYGFRDGRHWFVVGRKKDLIIVAGKNIYPEDIEDAVSAVPGVLPGRVVAFGREDSLNGTERVAVVAETSIEAQDTESLRSRIVAAVQLIDVTLGEVYLVPPRWLIKSSSGKPSRSANRDRMLDDVQQQGKQP